MEEINFFKMPSKKTLNKLASMDGILHMAVKNKDIDVCEMLLRLGADPNAKDIYGCVPIHEAINAGNAEICQLLIDFGASTNIKNYKDGMTLLHYAITALNGAEMCTVLIEGGANINAATRNMATPLLLAARFGMLDIGEVLLRHGASTECINVEGLTPLLWIVQNNGSASFLGLLIQYGANFTNKELFTNKTALHYAAKNGCIDIINVLIREGADVNAKDDHGYTPLNYALDLETEEALEAAGGMIGEWQKPFFVLVS